jgi:pyrimidine operon attenuation protein/uracil phosphoribosyltransferase
MPHPFLNIDDSIHLCICGAKPPFTRKPLVHGLQNLWFIGIKTFGSWVSKPLVHRLQNLWFIGIKTFGSWVSKPLVHGYQNLFSPLLKKKKI